MSNKKVNLKDGYLFRDVDTYTKLGSTAELSNQNIELVENSLQEIKIDGKRFNAVKIKVNKQIYLVAQRAIKDRGLLRSAIEAFNKKDNVIIDQKFIQRDSDGNSLTEKITTGSFVESGVDLDGVQFKSCKVKGAQNDVYVNEAALWKSIKLKDGFRIRDINNMNSFAVTNDKLDYGILKSYKRFLKDVEGKRLPFYKVLVMFEDGTQKKAFISVNALTNAPVQNIGNQATVSQVANVNPNSQSSNPVQAPQVTNNAPANTTSTPVVSVPTSNSSTGVSGTSQTSTNNSSIVQGSQAANNQPVNTTSTPSSRQFEVNPQKNSITINNIEYKVNAYGELWFTFVFEISGDEIEGLGRLKGLKIDFPRLTKLGLKQAKGLGEMKGLETLKFWRLKEISAAEIQALGNLKKLRMLNLNGTTLGVQQAQALGKLKGLYRLYLNGLTTLGVEQAKALGEMDQLVRLHLTRVASLSDKEKEYLDKCESLEVVYLKDGKEYKLIEEMWLLKLQITNR